MNTDPRPWGVFAFALFLAASLLHRALTLPKPPELLPDEAESRVPALVPLGPAAPGWQALLDDEGVDINAAPEGVLQQLPGIGPKLASRIVRERSRRPFTDVGDLTRVRGLGVRSVAKLGSHLRFPARPVPDAGVGPVPP